MHFATVGVILSFGCLLAKRIYRLEREMLKRFVSYYKNHMGLFITDMICAFVVACCDLVYPIIARNIINIYVPNQQLRLLLTWCAVLLGIYVLKASLNYYIQYWGHVMGVRMQADMRRDMFRKLQKLPFSFFDENKTGSIMSRIINDLQDVTELAHHGPEDVFLSLVMLVGSFILLARINLSLTCIVFAIIPFMVLFALKMRKMMNTAFRETRVETAEINANVETSIAGIRVSRAYTADEHETAKFESANKRFAKARSKAYRAMGLFGSGTGLFTDCLYLTVLVAGGIFFFNGQINAGDFTAYLLYISMFLKPINRLISIFEQIQNGATGFARFEEIMMRSSEPEDENALDVGALLGNISFDDVSFRYTTEGSADSEGEGEASVMEGMVIDHLSLEVKKGQTVALVGPSGGGKTTLCHLIPRFYEIQGGAISIDGTDIRQMSRLSLRRNIGIVAQDVFLFNGTIKENIAYGDFDATDEQIIDAAKKANIHDYIITMEQGYDTPVGERGVRLSGGQKQRISIARVFLKNPPILILDEATSALDNATEMLIQQSLEELGKGRTTVVVAHRLSTIKNADRIVVLTKNGIEDQGSHEELLARDGLYKTLYQYQFK